MEWKWREVISALPELRDAGVIDAAAAQRIEAYAEAKNGEKNLKRWSFYLLGLLGALLIGAGIITLLASNWAWIPRWCQTLIALIPLVVTGAFAVWSREKEWGKHPEMLDVLSVFWAASVFEAVALVARIYQLPSDHLAFLCTSTVLLIPVVYATRGTAVLLAYLIASFATVCASGNSYLHWKAFLFLFGFPALIAPVLRQKAGLFIKAAPSVMQVVWRWLLTLWLGGALILLTLLLGDLFGGRNVVLWGMPLLFASMYLAGGVFRAEGEHRILHRPVESIGLLGAVLTSCIIIQDPFPGAVHSGQWLLLAAALILSLVFGMFLLRNPARRYMFAVALVTPFLFVCVSLFGSDFPFSITPFLFWARTWGLLGVCFLLTGLLAGRRLRANVGLMAVMGCGVVHLVAWDISLALKGTAFIAAGLAFFALNFFFNRMKGGAQ